jgi:hypothetical protein
MTVSGGVRQLRSGKIFYLTDWLLLLMMPAPLLRHAPADGHAGSYGPHAATFHLQHFCGGRNEGGAKAAGTLVFAWSVAEGKIIGQGRQGLSRWRTAAKAPKKQGP